MIPKSQKHKRNWAQWSGAMFGTCAIEPKAAKQNPNRFCLVFSGKVPARVTCFNVWPYIE